MKPMFKIFLTLCVCVMQFGCVTQTLHKSNTRQSSEAISGFFISPDSSQLVVVGDQSHFIFSLNEPLRSVLQWQGRAKLMPSFAHFKVANNQSIQGNYTLRVNRTTLSESDYTFLIGKGFKLQPSQQALEYTSPIQGMRYSAGSMHLPRTVKFAKPYEIQLTEPEGLPEKAVKTALTPLTLAVDGVGVVLGGVILMPLVVLLHDLP